MFRDLLIRDLRGRFIGSYSGWLWLIFNPLLLLAVYGFVFGTIFSARVPAGLDAPFVVWLAVALWPWLGFSESILRASDSMPRHAGLISKVALPRELLTISSSTASFLLQMVGYAVVLTFVALTGVKIHVLGLPSALLVLAVMLALATGLGLIAAALRVFLRDIEQLLPTLLMFWFFLTPILYAPEMLPDSLQNVWMFNPLAGLVNDLRAALLTGQAVPGAATLWMIPVALVVLLAGRAFFRRLSPYFEDFL